MQQLSFPWPDLGLPATQSATPSPASRIYCNRNLRLDRIEAVGFDMDYTLAIYEQSEVDRLSIEATAKKLVERGYPSSLLTMEFNPAYPIRGLLVDKKLGNVLKMDRYRYVKRAYHGFRELTRDERRITYDAKRIRPGASRYHWVDTLYALAEVTLFAATVTELEAMGRECNYERLFADVRECIDVAHQDGSIVDVMMRDLPRYVRRDPELGATLHKLRSAGKKLFLLTNSRASYTHQMMTYLLDEAVPGYASWRHFFDIVVTSARKPRFFTGDEPFVEAGREGEPVVEFDRAGVYVGGNIIDFERLAQVGGDRILYVGDHIFGDVLRAKKDTAWRTIMIIQEMDREFDALARCEGMFERLDRLMSAYDTLHDVVRERQATLRAVEREIDRRELRGDTPNPELAANRSRHRRAIDRIRARLRAIDDEHARLEDHIERTFHPFWGSLLKAGPELSSFGDQVEAYACLYTTRVANLLGYSAMHYFRRTRDRMPHERNPAESADDGG